MTEQEKREKTIEEIESDLCNGCKYYKGKDLCCICEVEDYAKTLADLHYRKEEEVRKEIFNKLIEVSKNFNGNLPLGVLKAWAIDLDDLQEIIKQEFGVEVEE